MCVAAAPAFPASPLLSSVLFLLGAIILTAYEGVEIIPEDRDYRVYHAWLFTKRGQRKKYQTIDKIFINSGKVSQKIYTAHTTNSATFSKIEYNAWLKFGDGETVFLTSDKSKSRLLRKLDGVGRGLQTTVTDNTVAHSAPGDEL